MNTPRKFGIVAVTLTAVTAAFFGASHALGLRLNVTESAPVGIWKVAAAQEFKRGDLVEVCPPKSPLVSLMADRGYLAPGGCPAGVVALLKPIAAIAGDVVTISEGRPAKVNNLYLPFTLPMPAIPGWPDGTYTVATGYVWLFSTYSAGSFDSRYFGPVALSNVRGHAAPLLVSGNPADMTKSTKGGNDDRR